MRETGPRNVKEMLVEAKNTSELMVDLAYAALFYNSEDLSEEVSRLEERLNDLVFDMRTLTILAARSPADAEQMAGILQVVQDIEKIGNAAIDIAKIVVKRLGIPPELLHDIPEAEEIPSRVRVHADSALDGRSLGEVDLPVETGMRPIALRSEDDWNYDPEPEDVLRAGDVLFLQGPPEGVAEVRELAGARPLGDAPEPEPTAGDLSEIDRAVDILIEMKNLSEVAVGLAYSALLYLATASETIADCAMEMVWVVEKGEEVHPVLSAAIGESDEIVLKLTVSPGSPADGKTLGSLEIETETGMYALAVNRGGRWTYRPRDTYRLQGGDSLLVTGAHEGLEPLAELFGQELEESP